jgi:hypothetical protein
MVLIRGPDMNHVNLNTVSDEVRQVILSFNANGTIFELDGRPIACLVPPPTQPDGSGEWTTTKNARRFYLIDREIDGTITTAEKLELQTLEEQFEQFMDRVAPLPVDHARQLHQELMDKVRLKGATEMP